MTSRFLTHRGIELTFIETGKTEREQGVGKKMKTLVL